MSKEDEEKKADVEIEITNGKKVTFDLDYVEWMILTTGVCAFAWITGLML